MQTSEPHVAILGAGPTGLDAALAATDAGLSFTLFEAGAGVADNIRSWGHVRLFSPWDLNVSPRMRRHLEAAGHEVAAGTSCPTGFELVDSLLEPLAQLPEIANHLHLGSRVVSISREGMLKDDEIGTPQRSERPFRLLLSDESGREWVETATVVLDCTGNYANPNRLGDGGIPAPGERSLDAEIVRHIPDVRATADSWAGARILLVGAGYSAQTAAVDLADLAEEGPGTRVVWALRSAEPSFLPDPDDALPQRAALMERAQGILKGRSPAFEIAPGVVIESLEPGADGIAVTLRDGQGGLRTVVVDRVLSLTGYVPDNSLYRQLQVHECWATSGPMKLAAALLGAGGADCLDQVSHGADTLRNPEPDFYLLGAKSFGRNSSFLMRVGWDQVDEVFSMIAARAGSSG